MHHKKIKKLLLQKLSILKGIVGNVYHIVINNVKTIRFKLKNNTIKFGKYVQIIGMDNIELGKNGTISDGTWININNRGRGIEMSVGSNFYIGRDNFFTVGKKITIGDFFFTSRNCSLICASHFCDANKPYLSQSVDTNKSITIGSNVFLGANSNIIGNVTIGCGSIIGANTVVLDDIPPYCMAVGNPAKIVKYFDFEKQEWQTVSNPQTLKSIYPEEKYAEALRKTDIKTSDFAFARTYKKGWL